MPKPITGQYECVHHSIGKLEYFTSRIDRLILQSNGRFVLIEQDSSRITHAARSLINNQQVNTNAPETRREGNYSMQGNEIFLNFDDGTSEKGQVSWNRDGIQLAQDFFSKVSDSTLLPPTHRLKQDMEDIAKGIKIASTIGGMVMKAAKTISDTVQSSQDSSTGSSTPSTSSAPSPNSAPPQQPPVQQAPPAHPQTAQPAQPAQQWQQETLFCDQCGSPVRPGKRFCGTCGAQLP